MGEGIARLALYRLGLVVVMIAIPVALAVTLVAFVLVKTKWRPIVSVRDLLWVTLVCALALGWWLDRTTASRQFESDIEQLMAEFERAVNEIGSTVTVSRFPLGQTDRQFYIELSQPEWADSSVSND